MLLVAVSGAASAQRGELPREMREALEAPNADVLTVALNLAQSNPAYATQLLQAAIDLSGGDTSAAANEMKAFADLAAKLLNPGADQNADLAAALLVAVENIVGDPQDAALVNGAFAGIVDAANAETQNLLQNRAVEEAILDHAPGTAGVLQAQNGGPGRGGDPFGDQGGRGRGGDPGDGGTPSHPR